MVKKKDEKLLSILEDLLPDEKIDNNTISFISDFKGNNEDDLLNAQIPDEIPILPLRNMILFPTTVLPISVGRDSSLQLIK